MLAVRRRLLGLGFLSPPGFLVGTRPGDASAHRLAARWSASRSRKQDPCQGHADRSVPVSRRTRWTQASTTPSSGWRGAGLTRPCWAARVTGCFARCGWPAFGPGGRAARHWTVRPPGLSAV